MIRALMALAAPVTLACAASSPTLAATPGQPIQLAQTTADCQTMIASLRSFTTSVAISGKNAEKDRAGLVGKLDAASAALAAGKNASAIQKLNDFKNKVTMLEASDRISSIDAQALTAGADDAIACINGTAAG